MFASKRMHTAYVLPVLVPYITSTHMRSRARARVCVCLLTAFKFTPTDLEEKWKVKKNK
jgi:hypothetical protein